MTKIIRTPYLTPTSDRLQLGDWYFNQHDNWQPLTALLPDWDPAVPVTASISVAVDVQGVLEDCNLGQDAVIRVGALWNSSGTVLRGAGTYFDLDSTEEPQKKYLQVYIDGTYLAKSLEFLVQLILVSAGGFHKSFAPRIPGSILFSSNPFNVLLEGEGDRFPVEVIDFSSKHSSYPSDAGWVLHWDSTDLHQTVLGDMRLYLNSNHEHVIEACSGGSSENRDLREAIRFDVARTLIYGALNNDEFVEKPDLYEPGSVGAAVRAMLRLYFPEISFSQLQNNSRQQQSFDPKLQATLRAFWPEE